MNKVDSNRTGLRYAQEETLGVLPGSGVVWTPCEPNEYGDFGSEITTVARTPINASRQRKKGVVVDLDASAGFTSDLTQTNLYDLLPGFFFADWRKKAESLATAVASGVATVTSGGASFLAGDLAAGSGFGVAGNNAVHKVTASSGTTITASGFSDEASPPAGAKLKRVGFEFAAGDLTVSVVSGVAGINATVKDLTTLGLIPGEWVYIGGDAAGNNFAVTANNGFARVKTVVAGRINFDKTTGTMAADSGTGKTIRLYTGDVLKNESDPDLIVVKSYQLERSLSAAGLEYVVGCVPNQLTINMSTADKVTVDLAFVGIDSETVAFGAEKAGTRPDIVEAPAFNTTSDFSRLRLESDNTGLANFLMEASLVIDNGVTPLKALANLGAFDVSIGDFAVSGDITAYFSTLDAVTAVRENADATFDFAFVKDGAGMLFDVPLASLGNARLNVQKDQAIELPISQEAAEHTTLHHTLLCSHFSYLPAVAG